MKKLFLSALCCTFLFVSCSTENSTSVDTINFEGSRFSNYNIQIFKGIEVNDRFNVLGVQDRSFTSSSVPSEDPSLMTSERVAQVVEMILPDFPFESSPEIVLEMIQNDFPTLPTKQIYQNLPIIEDYYNLSFESEFISTYIEVFRVNPVDNGTLIIAAQNSTITSLNDDAYNALCIIYEAGYTDTLLRSIKAIYALFKANEALEISGQIYPNLSSSNTKRDAFRHILWSSLLANNYITLTSKQKRIDFAKAVGDANEVCNVNTMPVREMDLHNNQIGRDAFSNMSAVNHILGIPLGLTTPTKQALISETSFKVSTAKFIDLLNLSESQVLLEIENTITTQAIFLESSSVDDGNGNQCNGYVNPIDLTCCEDIIYINGVANYINCQ